jgi:hypothetical protein
MSEKDFALKIEKLTAADLCDASFILLGTNTKSV